VTLELRTLKAVARLKRLVRLVRRWNEGSEPTLVQISQVEHLTTADHVVSSMVRGEDDGRGRGIEDEG